MTHHWTKEMDLMVAAQLKRSYAKKKQVDHPFVTISREFGCDGIPLAERVVQLMNEQAHEVNWLVLDRAQLIRVANDPNLTQGHLEHLEAYGHSDLQSYIREAIFGMNNQVETIHKMAKAMRLYAARGNVVLLGAGSPLVTRDLDHGLHIYLHAPLDWRVANHAKRNSLDQDTAREQVQTRHDEREDFVKHYLGEEISLPCHYHLTINNAKVNFEKAAALIAHMLGR